MARGTASRVSAALEAASGSRGDEDKLPTSFFGLRLWVEQEVQAHVRMAMREVQMGGTLLSPSDPPRPAWYQQHSIDESGINEEMSDLADEQRRQAVELRDLKQAIFERPRTTAESKNGGSVSAAKLHTMNLNIADQAKKLSRCSEDISVLSGTVADLQREMSQSTSTCMSSQAAFLKDEELVEFRKGVLDEASGLVDKRWSVVASDLRDEICDAWQVEIDRLWEELREISLHLRVSTRVSCENFGHSAANSHDAQGLWKPRLLPRFASGPSDQESSDQPLPCFAGGEAKDESCFDSDGYPSNHHEIRPGVHWGDALASAMAHANGSQSSARANSSGFGVAYARNRSSSASACPRDASRSDRWPEGLRERRRNIKEFSPDESCFYESSVGVNVSGSVDAMGDGSDHGDDRIVHNRIVQKTNSPSKMSLQDRPLDWDEVPAAAKSHLTKDQFAYRPVTADAHERAAAHSSAIEESAFGNEPVFNDGHVTGTSADEEGSDWPERRKPMGGLATAAFAGRCLMQSAETPNSESEDKLCQSRHKSPPSKNEEHDSAPQRSSSRGRRRGGLSTAAIAGRAFAQAAKTSGVTRSFMSRLAAEFSSDSDTTDGEKLLADTSSKSSLAAAAARRRFRRASAIAAAAVAGCTEARTGSPALDSPTFGNQFGLSRAHSFGRY